MSTALLIVDMQNAFVDPESPFCIAGARATIPHLVRLLGEARARRWMVVHAVREHRSDGTDVERPRRAAFLAAGGYAIPGTSGARIVEELAATTSEYRVVKPRFSAFMQTSLDAMLRRHAVERLVICGTQYPNCVRATAFDALSLDYDVVVALEATSAHTTEVAAANIHDLRNVGIPCLPIAEILAADDSR